MKFDNHAVVHFVEAAVPAAVVRRRLTDAESVGTFSEELHYIVCAARELRAEAEGFVSWANFMGENVEGSPTWGAVQVARAASWRAQYRPMAAAWRLAVDAHYKSRAAQTVDCFWGSEFKTHYPAEVTESARRELGI